MWKLQTKFHTHLVEGVVQEEGRWIMNYLFLYYLLLFYIYVIYYYFMFILFIIIL